MRKLFHIIYILLIIITVYLISITQVHIVENAAILELSKYYYYCIISSLLFCFLGFLSTKQWFLYFSYKGKSVDARLLSLGIMLVIIAVIPVQQWIIWFGFGTNIFLKMLQSTYANHAIDMLAGIIIGKSFKFMKSPFKISNL